MTQNVVSRSQRRMEKKQTLLMVSLLLVVALVGFSLGVMVGRSGDQQLVAEERLPVQKPVVADEGDVHKPQVASAGGAERPLLTFFETLEADQQNALGSGINLMPSPPAVAPTPEPPSAAAKVETEPAVQSARPATTSAPTVAPTVAPTRPAVSATGRYLVQVASVQNQKGAEGLRDRMKKQGYEAFVEKVDLEARGIWHRVYAGPFVTREDADRAVESLKADRISSAPLVRQR